MENEKVKEIFKDADSLYQKAIEELEKGEIRDAAEKAMGVNGKSHECAYISQERCGGRGNMGEVLSSQ